MVLPNISGIPTVTFNLPPTGGNVYYVSSITGNTANAGTADSPKATLAQAYALCVASNGDMVVLLPGHAETLAGTTTLNKAGVQIIGLGDASVRPRLTWGGTDSQIAMSASSNTIRGVKGSPGVDAVAAAFYVTAADCEIQIEWNDATNAIEAQRIVLTSDAASHLRVDLEYHGFTDGDNCLAPIQLVGGSNHELTIDFFGLCATAIVNIITTPTKNLQVILKNGYVQGITNQSRLLVDTITGSTWALEGFDGAAGYKVTGSSGKAIAVADPSSVIANLTVPTADAATNAYERDVIGNKADAGVSTVAADKSIMAYAKGAVGVVGAKADAASYGPGTQTLQSYAKGTADLQEKIIRKPAAVMANNDVIFTIAGGPIQILQMFSICETANDSTASTVKYVSTGTLGTTSNDMSAASDSLASMTAGTIMAWVGTSGATKPNVVDTVAAQLGSVAPWIVPAGTIKLTVAVGTTTGTWSHYLRYKPLMAGVTVS